VHFHEKGRDRKTDRQRERESERDRQTNRQTDRKTGRQTDRETYRQTETLPHIYELAKIFNVLFDTFYLTTLASFTLFVKNKKILHSA
jgi:hypothetical protein